MTEFDIAKYEDRIEASRRRMAAASRFEEGDMVPTSVSAGGSYFAWLFGVNIRDYYADIDTQIEVQARAVRWRFENVNDDRTDYGIALDPGPTGEAIVFGADVVYPDNTSPRIVPFLETPADIEKLQVPDPKDNPRVREALDRARRFKERAEELGVRLPVGVSGVGIHPPLSCACAIMEPRIVYEMMATDPEPIQMLFRKCFDAFCMVKDYMDELFAGGKRSGHLGLADDNSAFVSDPMYREQVLPWNLKLYERYGFKGRFLHADGPNEHHYRTYVEDVKLNRMDIGGWSKIEPAVEIMKGRCVFSGNMNCRDFYGEFDEELKKKIRYRIRIAAPGGGYIFAIGGETYPRVNPDTLVRGFDYAHEIGKYPITIPPED